MRVPKIVNPGLRKPRTNQARVNKARPATAPNASHRVASDVAGAAGLGVLSVMGILLRRYYRAQGRGRPERTYQAELPRTPLPRIRVNKVGVRPLAPMAVFIT